MNQDLSLRLQTQIIAALHNKQSLCIRGSGSKDFLGKIDHAEILQIHEHRGIVSYDPVELVVTARAGTPLHELENALAEHGQKLAFEPPHFGPNASLGGTIACGLAGPARPFSGSARDYVLGAKIINGKGEILQFGGQVMKNVAGYDCSRLMAGAMGTLGVILDVSLKVLPIQAAEVTIAQNLTLETALTQMNYWSGKSLPLTAACYDGKQLFLRLSGAKTAVESAQKLIGGEIVSNGKEFWYQLKEQQLAFFQSAQPLWRLSLPATVGVIDLHGSWLIDWAGSQRWLLSEVAATDIRRVTQALGGHATLFRRQTCDATTFHPVDDGIMQLHRNLKTAFDPAGIFNRNRLYPDF